MKYFIPLLYLIFLINLFAFAAFGIDKRKAVLHKRRISEKALFTWAICFGAIGAFTGMLTFRHKTKKWYFKLFIPLLALLQVGFVVMVTFKLI